ncbi:MAG: hypothetical protein H6736_16690 [Alphaproteobacteria bacterium]|nr:hypothetical protein [Alphaproteobacteria bacterium]MCB9693451.1 hypothetical protein [Alphaproteobacteria bacterium]
MIRAVVLLLSFLALCACEKEGDVVWRQFNSDADSVLIEVEPGETSGLAEVTLMSNLGITAVGTATVDPARGPVGTEHELVVLVDEEFADRVERASVSSVGARGEESYDLVGDNARAGVFALVLTSLGEADESRIDTWRIDLWEAADNPVAEGQ